ncbi:kelch-like protein 34 [Salvelinus sp. IW2-2015]|uniref:kelch-like protein 34 n=1 Tax=Salvelinus sp. IW2-2015 TaxID=2691554 RepID=UPI000CEA81C3|nr:kelch-like protein 34 [Salvelinus alpinus]
MENYSLLHSSYQSSVVFSGFRKLRSDRRLCDVVLETGGVSFPCHRVLLASSSQYFWCLFGEKTEERIAASIRLPALTPAGLETVLDFLYSGWLSLSAASLPVVLETARYLQVDTAVSLCERFLSDGLSLRTSCFYANLAEHHFLPDALAASNQIITMEMATLLREDREGLLGLNVQSLTDVLDREELPGVKEVELLKLVLDWLDANQPLPLVRCNLLLSRLRFGLVTPSDITTLSSAHTNMNTPLMRSKVTQALEYHWLGSARPIRQSRHSSLRAAANHVLLVGGGPSTDWPQQQVLTFDLRDRKWSSLSAGLPRRLKNHCVCCVGGFLFVIGGEEVKGGAEGGEGKSVTMTTTNRVWRYDPRFACWEEADPMLERRSQFSCCVVDHAIYTIGGTHTHSDTHSCLASVEFYDMAAGHWRRGISLPRPLYGHASVTLGTGILMSGGSHGNQARTQVSSQEGNQGNCEVLFLDMVARGGVWDKRAPMSIGRFGHRMATVAGCVYALLGMYEHYCDIERYDSLADQWTRLHPVLIGSFDYGLVATANGRLLLFGGRKWRDGQEVSVASVLEYDTERDRWAEICQLHTPLTGTQCVVMALSD